MSNKTFDSLIEYGISFQVKSVSILLKNPIFLEQIHDIVDPKYYDSDSMKWIVKTILNYYQTYNKPPTLEVFKLELEREIENKITKDGIIEKLRSVYNNFTASDLDYVQENFLNFTKNQVVKKALLESANLMQRGENHDVIRNVMNDAFNAGTERNIGVIWKEQEYFNRRVEETLRSPLPTPWDVLNEILDGGLGAGELGVVVAPGGIGKCVGADTEIDIEYEEMGVDVLDYTIWFNSWDKVCVGDKYMFMYEFVNIIADCIAPLGKST